MGDVEAGGGKAVAPQMLDYNSHLPSPLIMLTEADRSFFIAFINNPPLRTTNPSRQFTLNDTEKNCNKLYQYIKKSSGSFPKGSCWWVSMHMFVYGGKFIWSRF